MPPYCVPMTFPCQVLPLPNTSFQRGATPAPREISANPDVPAPLLAVKGPFKVKHPPFTVNPAKVGLLLVAMDWGSERVMVPGPFSMFT